jgi:ribosomal protein S18 acetylase RimI-like enzyme
MIRLFRPDDLPDVMDIWLGTNLQAHDFVNQDYWTGNFEAVKEMLPAAEVYVYEEDGMVHAFAGIDDGYIAGIFVLDQAQSKGIGKQLLEKCRELYPVLTLSVYVKNQRAVSFYLREGFCIEERKTDVNTGESEYFMIWRK